MALMLAWACVNLRVQVEDEDCEEPDDKPVGVRLHGDLPPELEAELAARQAERAAAKAAEALRAAVQEGAGAETPMPASERSAAAAPPAAAAAAAAAS